MTNITTQGIVDSINSIEVQKAKLSWLLADKKQELADLWIYQEIKDLETSIRVLEQEENEIREAGKQLMINSGLKKFEALNGTIIQLNKTPWVLVIEDESNIPKEYYKEKTTITLDKTTLKEDLKQGLIIDWVFVSEDYKLVIK